MPCIRYDLKPKCNNKYESKSVYNLQKILNEVAGIFLARGYIGLEVPMEKVNVSEII